VPAPEITVELLGGRQAAEHAGELQALAAAVGAEPPYQCGDEQAARFAGRFRVQRRQPGFVLAQARSGGYLVGYALGMPLRPSTSWWRGLTVPLPADFTDEHPGRTFALAEVLVRAPWRRQGIARDLHDLIMGSRAEERATATVRPAAAPAQGAFQAWGWHKVGRKRDPEPGSPLLDIFVRNLPAGLHELAPQPVT
jgi:GNAT superfamily N-acetyltransferase